MRSRILTVFGTRPEAIKIAPVIAELRRHPDDFSVQVATTGQHRELLDQVLRTFDIRPDHDLQLMTPGQEPIDLLGKAAMALRPLLQEAEPDLVLVQGDTTTTLAAALASAHLHVPVGHIEAGLRSGSFSAPFPEEMNRRLTTRVSSYHFASTMRARQNLLDEAVPADRIWMTGNTVVDALLQTLEHLEGHPVDLEEITPGLDWEATQVVLVTGHRRESFGKGFGEICDALDQISERHPDVHIVYPVHLNPHVHDIVHERLGKRGNIHLLPPTDYLPFVKMMSKCHLILTDSGGIQEEAPTLGKPILVMREVTERPETIEAGAGLLVGTSAQRIVAETERLLTDPGLHQRMATVENPHGDGRAASHIVSHLRKRAPYTLE